MTLGEAEAEAEKLRIEVGHCERCLTESDYETHEILRGSLRRLARGHRCCSLVLCRACHKLMGGMAWEKQLMILWQSRRDDMHVLEFWKIAGRRKPTVEELLEAMHHELLDRKAEHF